MVYTCENRELLKICFEEEDELRPDLAEELFVRRRAFDELAVATLERHLADHPRVELAMRPTVFVNMCLGAVNWTYKWYRPAGARTPAELGHEMAGALLAVLDPGRARSTAGRLTER